MRSPPRERDVPAWLRRSLLRALQPEPGDRFPALQALLVEVARDPALHGDASRWAPWWLGSRARAGRPDPPRRPVPPCRGVDAPALELWTDAARARVATAFGATGRPAVDG
ncbi:MAG: hypothetical protein IPL61_06605 [Myxococcales bacterium]|nr:hypothetical protein [Myxococcales bacterium]